MYYSTPDLPGNMLTSDDLDLLVYELLDVSAQWYPLGLQLNVKTKTLEWIRRQYQNFSHQLREMLKVWLITNDKPSWKTLMDALRSRSVGASQLASVLETKYCLVEENEVDIGSSDNQPETNVTPPSPVSGQRASTLQQEVVHIQESK